MLPYLLRGMLFSLLAAAAHAGVIEGVVLERASGLALARTTIRLDPVPVAGGAPLKPMQTRTGRRGEFRFLGVPDGLYLVTATRAEYAPVSYGQKRPGGYGTPVQVTVDSSLFADLRMIRKGAISGRVLDENGIGIEGVTVIAYRARLPLRQAGHAESDDRGVYRIHGLDAGKYWIRSGAFALDDGSGLLPTFSPQSREPANAGIHQVSFDQETNFVDVEPEAGSLVSLSGRLSCAPEPEPAPDGSAPPPVNLTLSSPTARKSLQLSCGQGFRYVDLAPGRYELFGQLGESGVAGFAQVDVEKDTDMGALQLTPPPAVQFQVSRSGQGLADIPVKLTGWRDDLSQQAQPKEIKTPRTTLAPGHWNLQGTAGAGQYIESIGTPLTPQQIRSAGEPLPGDSFRVTISSRPGMSVPVVVAEPAAAIAGKVVTAGQAAPGIPVFLWPANDETQRQTGGPKVTLSNTAGAFRFDGLPPGLYRLLATMDVSEIDEEVVNLANAPMIRAETSEAATVELGVWTAP